MKTGTLLAPLVLLPARAAAAGLVAEPPPGIDEPQFYERLHSMLEEIARSKDPALRQLCEAARTSPATIRIRPITDDRSTWSSDGKRSRGHTEPDDRRPKNEGRSKPADATSFVPPDAVEPGKLHWKSGTLVHELTHAIDLANGRYSPADPVRERRATFMQNIWRAQTGFALRTTYHDRFPTLDYQEAIGKGAIDEYLRYILTRSDFPAPPHLQVPAKGTND